MTELGVSGTIDPKNSDTASHATRRDFLYYATAASVATAVGAAGWGLINQMNPSADVRALSTIEVDISGLALGAQLSVLWQGKPVFIKRRTESEIRDARSTSLDDLIDPIARNDNITETSANDTNRSLDEKGEWLVMIGVCTHLGCVPIGEGAGEFNGWFCPCHGSHYDSSGRIRKGPAPHNLLIPKAKFINDSILLIG